MAERKLSVVFLVVGWPGRGEVGGGARYVFRLASELASLVDLTIVTSAGGTPVRGARMVEVPEWSSRFGHYYGFPLKVRRILRELSPDVIHAFGDDWALRKGQSLLVRTFLGSSLSEARSSRGVRALNHYVLAMLERISQARADVRIGIGPESVEMFNAGYLMAPISPLAISSVRVPTDQPTVTFVGSWHGRKRGELAYQAVSKARVIGGKPIELTVFGPSSDRDNWPDDVRHLSNADDVTLQTAMQRSWLLLAPSAYEGFGIPAFEAMSLGVPVIASPNPGSDFLASAVADRDAFSLIADDDLPREVARRVELGPAIGLDSSRQAMKAVAAISRGASASYLLDEIYRSALGSRTRFSGHLS